MSAHAAGPTAGRGTPCRAPTTRAGETLGSVMHAVERLATRGRVVEAFRLLPPRPPPPVDHRVDREGVVGENGHGIMTG
jgi:hypothetical protein